MMDWAGIIKQGRALAVHDTARRRGPSQVSAVVVAPMAVFTGGRFPWNGTWWQPRQGALVLHTLVKPLIIKMESLTNLKTVQFCDVYVGESCYPHLIINVFNM